MSKKIFLVLGVLGLGFFYGSEQSVVWSKGRKHRCYGSNLLGLTLGQIHLEELQTVYELSERKHIYKELKEEERVFVEQFVEKVFSPRQRRRYGRMGPLRRKRMFRNLLRRKLRALRRNMIKRGKEAEFIRGVTALSHLSNQAVKNYFLMKNPSLAKNLLANGCQDEETRKLLLDQTRLLEERNQILERQVSHVYGANPMAPEALHDPFESRSTLRRMMIASRD
jgi:hypothetical protein